MAHQSPFRPTPSPSLPTYIYPHWKPRAAASLFLLTAQPNDQRFSGRDRTISPATKKPGPRTTTTQHRTNTLRELIELSTSGEIPSVGRLLAPLEGREPAVRGDPDSAAAATCTSESPHRRRRMDFTTSRSRSAPARRHANKSAPDHVGLTVDVPPLSNATVGSTASPR